MRAPPAITNSFANLANTLAHDANGVTMVPPEPSDNGQFGSTFDAPPPLPAEPAIRPLPGGRTVALGRGVSWLGEAWRMFKDAPGSWVACFLIFILIMIVLAIIPVLGNIAGALLSPLLIGGLMVGCRALERSDELEVSHLFAGFKQKPGPLFILGLLEFAISLVAMAIAAGVIFLTVGAMFLGVLMGKSPEASTALDSQYLMGALVVLLVLVALFIPVTMAVWFAPALVMLDDVQPWEALKSSFLGCLKNIGAFLLYGIVWILLGIVATIPLGLGWLVLGPVTIASVYTAYRDIFFHPATPAVAG